MDMDIDDIMRRAECINTSLPNPDGSWPSESDSSSMSLLRGNLLAVKIDTSAIRIPTADDEQEARGLLARLGWEKAKSLSAGDIVELTTLISDLRHLRGL